MKKTETENYLKRGLWIAFGIAIFWIGCSIIILLPSNHCFIRIPQDIGARGQLGDSFNIVTSFITSLTLVFLVIGVLYTHAQYKKLLKDSDEQKESSNRASFENSLFKMIALHNDVVNSMKVTKETEYSGGQGLRKEQFVTTGRECFLIFYEYLVSKYTHPPNTNNDRLPIETDAIKNAFDELYNFYGHHIGHYFRRLFHIIRFIDDSKLIPETEKYGYGRIVRSQLSNVEIKLLLYNALTPKGNDFSNYISKYKLLKGIAGEELLTPYHWDFAKHFFGEFWK
jgi:hypothetical protein